MKWKAWVTCVCALCWWGVLYPELCFPEETWQTVEKEDEPEFAAGTSCADLLKAQGDDVVVKSRLAEWLEEYLK
jgi:hypothetical protein